MNNKMNNITLKQGDYVLTSDIKDDDSQYHEIVKAFINAGCDEGEYDYYDELPTHWEAIGWCDHTDAFGVWDLSDGFFAGRQLTPEQVLSTIVYDDSVRNWDVHNPPAGEWGRVHHPGFPVDGKECFIIGKDKDDFVIIQVGGDVLRVDNPNGEIHPLRTKEDQQLETLTVDVWNLSDALTLEDAVTIAKGLYSSGWRKE